jgi:hypothetical protein
MEKGRRRSVDRILIHAALFLAEAVWELRTVSRVRTRRLRPRQFAKFLVSSDGFFNMNKSTADYIADRSRCVPTMFVTGFILYVSVRK